MVAWGPEVPWCDEEGLDRRAEREMTRDRGEKSQTVTHTQVTEKGTGHNRCGDRSWPRQALYCEAMEWHPTASRRDALE